MDFNIVGISLLSLLGFYISYKGYNTYTEIIKKPISPWNNQEGRTRELQSLKGDASQYIELRRRQTIQQSGRLMPSKIRETKTQLGSTTGALETFMLSAICPKLVYCAKNDIVYDGGNDEDEFCPIPGSDTKDGGNELTNVCCPQKDLIYDGGNEQNEFCPIPGSHTKDGGNELTNVCGI
jgi:hypothetical protein